MLEAYNPVLHFNPIAIMAKIVDRLCLWAGSLVYLKDLAMHGRLADGLVPIWWTIRTGFSRGKSETNGSWLAMRRRLASAASRYRMFSQSRRPSCREGKITFIAE